MEWFASKKRAFMSVWRLQTNKINHKITSSYFFFPTHPTVKITSDTINFLSFFKIGTKKNIKIFLLCSKIPYPQNLHIHKHISPDKAHSVTLSGLNYNCFSTSTISLRTNSYLLCPITDNIIHEKALSKLSLCLLRCTKAFDMIRKCLFLCVSYGTFPEKNEGCVCVTNVWWKGKLFPLNVAFADDMTTITIIMIGKHGTRQVQRKILLSYIPI